MQHFIMIMQDFKKKTLFNIHNHILLDNGFFCTKENQLVCSNMKEPQDAEIDLLVCKTLCFNNPVSNIQGYHGQGKNS